MTKNADSEKQPGCCKNLRFYLTEYCENTSIHGFKFLGEQRRTFVEKIWWFLCIATSLYFCVVFIKDTYEKWNNSPVIVTFATTATPIWDIPFPAVTICPEIKSKKHIYNYTEKLLLANNNLLEREDMLKVEYMSTLCNSMFHTFFDINFTTTTLNNDLIDFFLEVAPRFNETILVTNWMGNKMNMSNENFGNTFTPVLTSAGICYSFNLLDRNELYTTGTNVYKHFGIVNRDRSNWTLEKGYANDADLDTFPRRTMMSGVSGGLDLVLYTKKEDVDPLCGDSIHGYKVVLQHPTEIPRSGQKYFRVDLNQHVVAAVKPNIITTDDVLKDYSPEDRQCYFLGEKKLKFFQVYNQDNCLFECLANFTYAHCNCVAFYMPRDDSIPICGALKLNCIKEMKVLYLYREVVWRIKYAEKGEKQRNGHLEKNISKTCNCLPSCNSIKYDTEISQSDWDWIAPMKLLNASAETESYHYSRLVIFFKDMQFITSERNELYGKTDFLANCGGLLGLFTGFSFISMAEILYFATLRFMCNLRKYGRHYWSGMKELTITETDNDA